MASILDELRAALTRKNPTAATLERDLSDAIEKLRRASERVISLEGLHHSPETLATEGALPKLRLTLQGARDEAEDAAAYVAEIGRRHADAVASEAEAGRRERYSQAERAREAAAKTFMAEYPAAAQAFAKLARTVWEADALVAAANADAPTGAPPLEVVEAVRDRLSQPRKELPHEDETVWRTDDLDAFTVSPTAERVEREDGVYARRGTGWFRVRKRIMRTHKWISAAPAEAGDRLHTLTLPGLRRGEPDVLTGWRLFDLFGIPVAPALGAALEGLETLAKAKPQPPLERGVETRSELLPLIEPAAPRVPTPWPDEERGEPFLAVAPRTRTRSRP